MPRGDGTGPEGFGVMTGRGAGYCAGFDRPGFMNDATAQRGMARGFGRGAGRGRSRGQGYRNGFGRKGASAVADQEIDYLKKGKETLKNELEFIQERLNKLENENDE
jgi:hypothetical protein